MPVPVRATFPADRDDLTVQVTDDGSLTLVKTGSDDAFHSGCGAMAETQHVYLAGSGVTGRLSRQQPTRVLEIGLGTSMAMLMTVDAAIAHGTPLDYVAIETDWIGAATLGYLKPYDWVTQPDLVDAYLAFRQSLPDRVPQGNYLWRLDSERTVTVQVGDFRKWTASAEGRFDAIYYDPFCPESAPDLWTAACLSSMRALIADDGRLTTYSCSRVVRTALEHANWKVDRVAGPKGGKRQVIVASPIE